MKMNNLDTKNKGQVYTPISIVNMMLDYAGYVFLTDSALARDEYGEVGGSHRHGRLEGPVERRVVAYDVIPVLEPL